MTIRPIRTAEDLQRAKQRLAALMRSPKATENTDEIETTASLIEHFEQRHSPVVAPDPILAIKFRMEERGMTPRELEPYIGSRARVSEVLSGKRQLSIDMIQSLHEGLGIPYESLISNRRNRNLIEDISPPAVQRLNELGFELDRKRVPDFLSSSLNRAPLALLRRTRTQRAASKIDQGALLLWQAAVLQKSETLTKKFQCSEFEPEVLRQLARMSQKLDGPKRALKKLRELGIAVVIMPPLPGTFLDGAAMVNSAGNPVIGLTLRHDRIDGFWFTLLHECAHISLHFKVLLEEDGIFVDDIEIRSEDEFEREADTLARESLIPTEILNEVRWNADTSYEELMMLSTRARVHPSVVAGRWQRDHQNYKKFSRFIDRNSIKSLLADVKF